MSSVFPLRCSSEETFPRMLDILAKLVALDTTSHKSNVELIRYVQALLEDNQLKSNLYWNEDGSKANLVATAGPSWQDQYGILWSGHTDVVPVDGQDWTSDPFELRLSDDRAIGRGTADMKGFIACCLALLSTVDNDALTVPISLVLTYEEEVGCVGARRLVADMSTWAGSTVGCIVGEPTGMKVVAGHKGKQNHRIQLAGEPGHAALAPGMANPVSSACELVTFAERMNERFRCTGPKDERFAIDHSWINVGRVEGGVKPNIVPDSCSMELEVRAIPGHSCDEIADELQRYADAEVLARMREKTSPSAISFTQLSDTPSFMMPEQHAFVDLVRSAFEQPAAIDYVPFGTEAGLFWGHAGVPTVVCGPGSISEAHTPDESIPLEQLSDCLSLLQSLPVT